MQKLKITGTQNNLIKDIVKLHMPKYRKEKHLVFIDGEKSVDGLIDDGFEIEYLFTKDDDKYSNCKTVKNLVIVNDEILKKISTTKSPSPVAAVIKEPCVDKCEFFKYSKIALIDGIKDAGNLGTIIRSAAAFSIDGIILFNDCVDLYNTKTIRASAQNLFKIPVFVTSDINFIKELKKTHKLISTVVNSKNNFNNYKFENNFILALGSEAEGISKEILDISDDTLTIELDRNVESLNLGVCASICFALIKNKTNL